MNRDLVASSYLSAGDAAPRRGNGRSPIDLSTRIAAVAETGWAGMGLAHADLIQARGGNGYAELRAMLEDAGIAHLELEFIRDWWTVGERRFASDSVRRDLFEAAAELGVKNIKVGATNRDDAFERSHFLEEFDRLATEAGEAGTRVALEPMRSSDILPSLREAADVTRSVDNPNGGLAIDCYHMVRAGITPAELRDIVPSEAIFIVELADGLIAVDGTMFEAEVNQRTFVGEGEFDVVGFSIAIHDLGYMGPWGVEILSDEYRNLPIHEALARAHRSALDILEKADGIVADRAAR